MVHDCGKDMERINYFDGIDGIWDIDRQQSRPWQALPEKARLVIQAGNGKL